MPPTKQDDDAKKRKAGGEASNARPKKMSKEEKASARERARQAMVGDAKGSKKKAVPAAAAPSPARRKRAGKSVGDAKTKAKAAPASKVTIQEDSSKTSMELPLPPTALKRTQSTPLELELEEQVVANLKADLAGKAPVFTEAPPDHLLKFAPKELEEGYDHDESNAKDLNDDEDNEGNPTPAGRSYKAPPSNNGILLDVLVLILWVYLFWGREGTFYHRWCHGIAAHIPLPGNPYRVNGKPRPFYKCFRTNVDDPPLAMRAECEDIPLTHCPSYATCYGGTIQSCAEPYLLLTSANRNDASAQSCEMEPKVQQIYTHVVNQVNAWTMDYKCDRHEYSKLFENYDESPDPEMIHTFRDTDPPTRQPMFILDYILDLDPFLLMKAPRGGQGRNPVQSLYHVLEAANQVQSTTTGEALLKLQITTKFGKEIGDQGEREVHHVHLVAQTSSHTGWRRYARIETQCTLLRTKAAIEFAARTPWLVSVWVVCMVMFLGWLVVMRHYWKKAQEQQQVLTAIEGVRNFVLETLKTSAPKQWKGTEMLEFVVRTYVPPEDVAALEEPLMRKRIWPRVCFDVRGNSNVAKSVIVSGGDLVDMWKWEPAEEAGDDS